MSFVMKIDYRSTYFFSVLRAITLQGSYLKMLKSYILGSRKKGCKSSYISAVSNIAVDLEIANILVDSLLAYLWSRTVL